MIHIRAKVVKNKRVKNDYFLLAIDAPAIAKASLPGQFVTLKVGGDGFPFLRRPFSVHRVDRQRFEIIYEVLGRGTEILSNTKPGEILDIIGPLGTGFDFYSPYTARHVPVLVAGGMGVAPLIFLAEKLKEIQSSKFKVQSTVFIGARTKERILCEKEFKNFGYDVTIATDDGSRGFKGTVVELLTHFLSTVNTRPNRKGRCLPARQYFPLLSGKVRLVATIYACGPQPMLRAVSEISQKYALTAQLSLEAHMACGIGACLGCVVNTAGGYKRVCKEGPVFDAREVIW